MKQIKIFYGKVSTVEEQTNDFLEYLSDNDYQLLDIKQSIDPDPEAIHTYLALMVLYKTKER